MKMRIGVDATCWATRRGYGRFVRALLTATLAIDHENEYTFFVDSDNEEFPLPTGQVEVIRADCGKPTSKAAGAGGRRSLRDMWSLRRTINKQKLELFFFPSVYSYVPLRRNLPKIVAVHDVIPELYPKLVFPTLRSKLYWRAKVRLACAQAEQIVTVSEYSRRSLAKCLSIEPARLRVVDEASDPEFRRIDTSDHGNLLGKLGIPSDTRFLVYVGGFSPHKNLHMLVDVFRELQSQPQFVDLRLLLIGDYERDVFYSCYKQIAAQVQQSGLQDKILFTGYLDDQVLIVLLNLAQALVLPSFCEGFGLPAIEAAACGAPTVVTTNSPMPELLGQGTIGVEPGSRAGLLAALAWILGDPAKQQTMRKAALAAAARFSWENSARQLLDIFEEVGQSSAATT
jgi:glycosyltransferase involved in cell wall biosynthesis